MPQRRLVLCFVLLLLGCQEEPAPSDQPEASWLTDYDEAVALARERNDPLLLDFTGSDWCPPCIQLDRQVFRSERFREWSEGNVVLLKVDFPTNKELLPPGQLEANRALEQRFRVDGYPTLVVVDVEGRELARWVGYGGESPDAWIERFQYETGHG